jgi:hypothetical protein
MHLRMRLTAGGYRLGIQLQAARSLFDAALLLLAVVDNHTPQFLHQAFRFFVKSLYKHVSHLSQFKNIG